MTPTALTLIIWGVSMSGYIGFKVFMSSKPLNHPSNDLSKKIRKIKIKNERYLSTKSIFK